MFPRIFSLLFVMLALAAGPLGARDEARVAVDHAQALLGPESWSQVIKINNTRPGATHPSVVYALVFELEQRLWFYAPHSGTESLSLEMGPGCLARDKRSLGPLLREIHAGFQRHEVLAAQPALHPAWRAGGLPHGCFVESVGYLRTLLDRGVDIGEARLLAYYAAGGGHERGHTVLYFVAGETRYCFDPADPGAWRHIAAHTPEDALAIARQAVPDGAYAEPVRAVFLPLRLPSLAVGVDPGRVRLAKR